MSAQKAMQNLREAVYLVDYDPTWVRDFDSERATLEGLLRPHVVGIHHYGSTAIPGMRAKPIIDILLVLPSYATSLREVKSRLESSGYEYEWRRSWGRPDLDPHAHVIKRNAHGLRTHHIHIVEIGSIYIQRVAITQLMIKHSWLATLYLELKEELAQRHRTDRATYTRIKSKFLEAVCRQFNSSEVREHEAREILASEQRVCKEPQL